VGAASKGVWIRFGAGMRGVGIRDWVMHADKEVGEEVLG